MFAVTVFVLASFALSHGHPLLEAVPRSLDGDTLVMLVPTENGYEIMNLADFDNTKDDRFMFSPSIFSEMIKSELGPSSADVFYDSDDDDDDNNEIESRFIRRRRSTSEFEVEDEEVKKPSKWRRRIKSGIEAVKEFLRNSPVIISTLRDGLEFVKEIRAIIREAKALDVKKNQ